MRAVGVGVGVALMVLAACSKKDAEQPPADFSNPAVPAQPAPAKYALADFQHLRFLEGAWRGTLPDGGFFYESYHFLDDSTIFMAGYADSTLKTKKDSARIVYRNGAVLDSGGAVAVAEKLDSNTVDFRAAPTSHFAWTRQGPDAWVANIYNRQPDGTERTTTYQLKRIRK